MAEATVGFDEFDAMGQFTDTVAGDVRDPYPDLWAMRRDTPVTKMRGDSMVEPDEAYVVYRYDDVAEVLRDNERFSSSAVREMMAPVMGPYVLVGMDEPEHRRHRSLVSQAFRQKSLAHWKDDYVEESVNQLIDRFAGRGRAELVREFTFRFPVQVIAKVLGIPPEDCPTFHEWAVSIVNSAADPVRGLAASASMRDYLAIIVDRRRADPGDDVVSDLATAELDGEVLDDEEIFSFLRLLLPAGAETTYRATGNFLFGLLSHPDQVEALRGDRSLMEQAVEVDPVVAASHHLPHGGGGHRDRGHPRRGRRPGDPPRGLGQPRRQPVGGPRLVRHLPRAQADDRLRARPPHVPRHAPGPHGDGLCRGCRARPPARHSTPPRRRRPPHPRGCLPVAHRATGRLHPVLMAVKISIDPEKCMGSGNCAFWAPGTFDVGEDNIAYVLDPDGDPLEKIHLAREAVRPKPSPSRSNATYRTSLGRRGLRAGERRGEPVSYRTSHSRARPAWPGTQR